MLPASADAAPAMAGDDKPPAKSRVAQYLGKARGVPGKRPPPRHSVVEALWSFVGARRGNASSHEPCCFPPLASHADSCSFTRCNARARRPHRHIRRRRPRPVPRSRAGHAAPRGLLRRERSARLLCAGVAACAAAEPRCGALSSTATPAFPICTCARSPPPLAPTKKRN